MKILIRAAQNKQRGRQFDMPALDYQRQLHFSTSAGSFMNFTFRTFFILEIKKKVKEDRHTTA